MEEKIYFTVQEIKKTSCGFGMYAESVTNTTHYEEGEIEKAIKHWKKKKSNKIIMTRVKLLDKAPYIRKTDGLGEKVFGEHNGEKFDEFIEFQKFDVRYKI